MLENVHLGRKLISGLYMLLTMLDQGPNGVRVYQVVSTVIFLALVFVQLVLSCLVDREPVSASQHKDAVGGSLLMMKHKATQLSNNVSNGVL